ncbi:MAG: ribosome silencing factor [Hyphomicrobium sp.]|nr:ribosome silencing factor [Hyphomicrobium sp.]
MRDQPAKDVRRLIRTTTEAARKGSSLASSAAPAPDSAALLDDVVRWLDDAKAEEIVSLPLKGKSALGDYMVVASGRSHRHVAAVADHLLKALRDAGMRPRVEGLGSADWVLIDAGDVIVHVFRPEVREFYSIEEMWQAPDLEDETVH